MEPQGEASGAQGDGKMPRWVKIFGLVVLLVLGIFVTVHFLGLSPRH